MQKITVKLPPALVAKLNDEAKALVATRKKTLLRAGDPPISQLEWLSKTPEGKQFTNECMNHKYAKLSQVDLNKVLRQKYYATYGLAPRKPGRPKIEETINFYDVRSELIQRVISDYYDLPTDIAHLQLVINNQ